MAVDADRDTDPAAAQGDAIFHSAVGDDFGKLVPVIGVIDADARFGAKIGLQETSPQDQPLIEELLAMMQAQGADFTNTFAALGTDTARAQFTDRAAFDAWAARWQARAPDAAIASTGTATPGE